MLDPRLIKVTTTLRDIELRGIQLIYRFVLDGYKCLIPKLIYKLVYIIFNYMLSYCLYIYIYITYVHYNKYNKMKLLCSIVIYIHI